MLHDNLQAFHRKSGLSRRLDISPMLETGSPFPWMR
jgi:hypothetical protein